MSELRRCTERKILSFETEKLIMNAYKYAFANRFANARHLISTHRYTDIEYVYVDM